jgi:shikimate dehydrogenase
MMGSGKSTIAKLLAAKLNLQWLDLDQMLEEKEACSISQLVEKHGFPYFRKLESEILKSLQFKLTNSVVSTGGGVILNEDNCKILKSLGKVIWLKASSQVICERIKFDTSRPLIEGNNEAEKLEKIDSILKARHNMYQETADLIVAVDDTEPTELVQNIINKLGAK